jgi:hypothetical protein
MVKIFFVIIIQIILISPSLSFNQDSIKRNKFDGINNTTIGQLLSADDNFIYKWDEASHNSLKDQINLRKYDCIKNIGIVNYLLLITSFSINSKELERNKMLKIIGTLKNLGLNERKREKYINFFKKEKINFSLRWQFLQFLKDSANFTNDTYKTIYIMEIDNNGEILSHHISLFGINEKVCIRYNYFTCYGEWTFRNSKILKPDDIQNFYNQLNPGINCKKRYLHHFTVITKITYNSIESKVIAFLDHEQSMLIEKLMDN